MKGQEIKGQRLRAIMQFLILAAVVIICIMLRFELKGLGKLRIIGVQVLNPLGGLQVFSRWFTNGDLPLRGFIALATLFVLVGLALTVRRLFCGWVCPFGTFQDYCWCLRKKVSPKNYQIQPSVDRCLRWAKYLILLVILCCLLSTGGLVTAKIDPWTAFVNIPGLPAVFKELAFAFLLLGLVFVGACFIERCYCRYLCPLGALQAIIARFGLVCLKRTVTLCNTCRQCQLNCPMGIELTGANSVSSGECINCLRCMAPAAGCNTAFELRVGHKMLKPAVYMLLGACTAGVIWGSGVLMLHDTEASKTILKPDVQKIGGRSYNDGTYYGEAAGFNAPIKVMVTVESGQISKIRIIRHQETPGYYELAIRELPEKIIAKQSTDVDTIAGATITSQGIKQAVQNALEGAGE